MSDKVVRGPIHEFLDDPEGCGFDPDDDVVLILASEYERLKASDNMHNEAMAKTDEAVKHAIDEEHSYLVRHNG